MALYKYFIPVARDDESGEDNIAVTLVTTLTLLIVISVFNFVGVFKVWYWRTWWYDVPMHLAGGAWSALLFFYIFEERWKTLSAIYRGENKRRLKILITFALALSFVALIGVLWEFFEFLFDTFVATKYSWRNSQQGLMDTMGDLFNDLLGGLALSVVYFMSKLKRKLRRTHL